MPPRDSSEEIVAEIVAPDAMAEARRLINLKYQLLQEIQAIIHRMEISYVTLLSMDDEGMPCFTILS